MKIRGIRYRAFTLAELLIALLFISIALFGFIALQMRLLDSNERLQLKQEAVWKAESELAESIARVRASRDATITAPQPVSAESAWSLRDNRHEYKVDSLILPVRAGW